MEVSAAKQTILEFYDPMLHLATKPLDLTGKQYEKALKLHSATGWSSPVAVSQLTQLRAAVGYWLGSGNKAVVGQDDLDRLSMLTSMMLSFAEEVVQLQYFTTEWTSPLSVNQAPGSGLVGALVGVAGAVAGTAVTAAAAAASSAVSGKNAGEVLRSGWSAAVEVNQARAAQAAADQAGLSPAAQRTMWQAASLQQESAMWVFAYAAAARQAGLQRYLGYARASRSPAGSEAGGAGGSGAMQRVGSDLSPAGQPDPVADSVAALQLLRQAAGLFEHLVAVVIPRVDIATDQGNKRPPVPELQRNVGTCLVLVCLAEAQAITVARAKDKGTSPGLLASLEAGAAQLYLMARMALCGTPIPPVTATMGPLDFHYTPPQSAYGTLNAAKRLHAYTVAGQVLYQCRSRISQALDYENKGEMGFAQSVAVEAEAVARNGVRAVKAIQGSEPSWAASVEMQRGVAAEIMARTEKDRLQITYQPLPKDPVDLPAVKVLVSVIPTAPMPFTPPELPVQQAAGGQPCSIQ